MQRRLMTLGLVFLGMLLWFGASVAVVRSEARSSPQTGDAIPPSLAVSEPWLVVSPTALLAQVPVNEQVVKYLAVGNRSLTSTLVYTITALPSMWEEGIIDWLDVTPTHGILPTDSVAQVDVTFDATDKPPGDLAAVLHVASNSLVAPAVVTVPVFLQVIEATVVPVVTPTALSADLLVGATSWQPLTLGNQGNATMLFTLTLPSDPVLEGVSWLDLSPPAGTVPAGGSRIVTATFDAAAMLAGTYQTNVAAHFNSQVTPVITVPVSMTVTAPAYYRGPIYSGSELDYQPSIIRVQPGGRLLVIFERINPATFSGDLFVTYSEDGGGSWSEPLPAIHSTLNERHPSLVQLGDGSFVLFYLVDETGAGAYRIHRATSSDGVAWTAMGAIDLGWSMPHQVNPNVIREADGTLSMTYHRYFVDPPSSGPSYIARSTDDGATWDTLRTQVSDSNAQLPRLAKRESDGLYIVTYQVGSTDLDLYAKISTDPYDWSGPQIPVSVDINTHDSQPIVLEDGTFLVVYAMTPIDYFDLFYRTSCDGVHWSDEVQVTDDPARYDTQPHPLLQGIPGHIILTWSHQQGATPYQDHDVWIDNDLPVRPSLCGSSKAVDPPLVAPGLHPLTYTLALPNIGQTTAVSLVDPIPEGTAYRPGSLWASGGHYGYDAAQDVITWTGTITTNEQVTLRFQVSTTLALADGEVVTNTAWFTDAAGMVYRAEAIARVDALPRSLILDPQDGQFISNTTYLISGVATDTMSGIASVAVSVDGGDWHPAVGQETWAFPWLGFGEGEHNLRSQATDMLGQVEVSGMGISVTVDTIPPDLVAVVPANGMADVPLDLPLSLEFSEPIERLDFHIEPNPGNLVIAGIGSSHIVVEHRDFVVSQTYTCTVQARDRAFNTMGSVTWSFRAAARARVYLPVVLRGLP